ncbi:MAG: ribonuclease R [Alphaproteobacteria bacterium]|nr:ribonuclease R [Alphaproteobacteria bacterium]
MKERGRRKSSSRSARAVTRIPEVAVLTITRTDSDGELIAEPVSWDARKKPPHIVVTESGRSRAAIVGDKVLCKLRKISPHLYQALVIKVLPSEAPKAVLGVFMPTSDGGLIEPVSRKMKESFMVARGDTGGAERGELVSGVTLPGMPSMGMAYAKIEQRLGSLDSPKAASLIAAHMHDLPQRFSDEAIREAEKAEAPTLSKDRVDLRDLPLVTIDGADARDFDDAVYAEPTKDGFMLVVAIADVAHYVAEGSALDKEAFQRGNSVYFPDRVIPMLPERLSNGLCSLNPNEDRYCLAVKLWIDAGGATRKYEFMRGLMRSRARLTYEEVEKTRREKNTALPIATHIQNLWLAYAALAKERDERGALALDLPEYKIEFDESGHVIAIKQRERLEAHKLIECFMIAANVAAADFLLKKKAGGIFRAHENPAEEKMEELRILLKLSGYGIAKGAITAKHLNRVLKSSEGKPEQPLVHTAVLRAQMQAFYAHENLGHFGLGLQKYCHFTSPIRRYADLVVHRALSDLCHVPGKKPTKHQPTNSKHLASIALHISETERKAMMAEREAMDRYKVAFMSKRIGHTFPGVVTGLNEYGLFITLPENGVTGFIPVRNLGGDFFRYDKKEASFIGNRTRTRYQMGMSLFVRVADANSLTGSLIFEINAPDDSGHPLRHYKRRR